MFVKNPEYFLAIVKERSISKAADRLYLSQPYLSQYLAKLESNLGVTLLDRSHTPLRLTPAGELFYAYLERQDYLDRQLESDLRTLQSQKPQQLHIGVSTWRGSILLPDILPRFSALYPGVEVRFFENNSVELDRMVLEGRTDFNIMHVQPPKENLEYETLGVDPFCLAAPVSWKERLGLQEGAIGKGELKRLEQEPFIMVARGQKLRQTADEILSRAQVRPKVLFSTKSMETAKRLVAAGMGLTLLPMSYTTLLSDRKGILCVPISEELEASWKIVIAYPKGEELPCCCREFLRLLRQRMRERQRDSTEKEM